MCSAVDRLLTGPVRHGRAGQLRLPGLLRPEEGRGERPAVRGRLLREVCGLGGEPEVGESSILCP